MYEIRWRTPIPGSGRECRVPGSSEWVPITDAEVRQLESLGVVIVWNPR
jgi:hypothetical protein